MQENGLLEDQFEPRFKLFHELMSKKVREILLISSPYDASVMDEDGRLSEAIINEYRGLNLSAPPRVNWVSSTDSALVAMDNKKFDLVIIMPRVVDTNVVASAERIRFKGLDTAHHAAVSPSRSPARVRFVSPITTFAL